MIKITVKQLQNLHACKSGIDWFKAHKKSKLIDLVPALLADNHFDYARWLLSRLLTHSQKVMWAINSAEMVLSQFEKKYADDKRPALAIEAAKKWLRGEITANAADAAYAAAYAAYAAAYAADAAYAAANAAANAANAAYAANAANAAANAANAAYAANAANAAYAAYAAANAAANAANAKRKICDYALKLLGEIP